jgi:Holliday junction resolvase RusA-like endonuclease
MRGKELLAGPLALSLSAVHPIPASWSKKRREAVLLAPVWKPTKPDLDNLIKAVSDGMNGIVYGDDALIVKFKDCDKLWGADPRVVVTLEELA